MKAFGPNSLTVGLFAEPGLEGAPVGASGGVVTIGFAPVIFLSRVCAFRRARSTFPVNRKFQMVRFHRTSTRFGQRPTTNLALRRGERWVRRVSLKCLHLPSSN